MRNKKAVKPLFSITPFTLLDYPDKTACILWFAGCNMRCPYCYNPEIVFGNGKLSFDDALKFIKTRVNLLDAVVLSGGECTLCKGIKELIYEIKKLGLLVKIDTNGTHPDLIKELVTENCVDFISLDFKALPEKFKLITASKLFNKFKTTLSILIHSTLNFEVRTTIHSELISEKDFKNMLQFLELEGYKGKYYLQNYLNAPKTIGDPGPSLQSYLPIRHYQSPIELILRNT